MGRLTKAASRDELDQVQKILVEKCDEDLNKASEAFIKRCYRAMRLSATYGRLKILKYFVDLGLDPKKSNGNLLSSMAWSGNLEGVKYLVSLGLDAKSNNEAIESAIRASRTEIVQYLYNLGCKLSKKMVYILRYPAGKGNLELIKFLVEKGCLSSDKNAVEFLIDCDDAYDSPTFKRDHDISPGENASLCMQYAASEGHFSVVEYLVEQGFSAKNEWILSGAISAGHLEMVDYLIKIGCIRTNGELSWREQRYNHGLFEKAVKSGNLNLVKYFVNMNCSGIDYQDKWLIKCTIKRGHLEIVKYLLELNTDKSKYDSLLETAAESDHLKIVEHLVGLGCNVTDQALISAAKKGRLEIVKYFVKLGCNPRAQKNSALIFATKNLHKAVTEYLTDELECIQSYFDITFEDDNRSSGIAGENSEEFFDDIERSPITNALVSAVCSGKLDAVNNVINLTDGYHIPIENILDNLIDKYYSQAKYIAKTSGTYATELYVKRCRKLVKVCSCLLSITPKKKVCKILTTNDFICQIMTQHISKKTTLQNNFKKNIFLKKILRPTSSHVQLIFI
jgi:ankyrin repeat protein